MKVERFRRMMEGLRERGLFRTLRVLDHVMGVRGRLEGRELTLFCSNDYLGLSCHSGVIEEARAYLSKHGAGSGASRLISGTRRVHEELEETIAHFSGKESALLFPSGYMANSGVIPALTGEGDRIFTDRLNHASIIDGCRLSRAERVIYPHSETHALASLLSEKGGDGLKLIVTEGLFSMDGDFAPLKGMVPLKDDDTLLMADEAHSFGIWGERGLGASEMQGVLDGVDIVMGTFGKALGGMGAFVATTKLLRETLINRARTFIFSTSLSPLLVVWALAAIRAVLKEPELRERCRENARYMRGCLAHEGFHPLGDSQIIPLLTGDEMGTMELSESLIQEGFLCQGIRPPVVPEGGSRLRITVSALHKKEEIERFVDALKRCAGRVGLILQPPGREG